jgi:hypothetical protein
MPDPKSVPTAEYVRFRPGASNFPEAIKQALLDDQQTLTQETLDSLAKEGSLILKLPEGNEDAIKYLIRNRTADLCDENGNIDENRTHQAHLKAWIEAFDSNETIASNIELDAINWDTFRQDPRLQEAVVHPVDKNTITRKGVTYPARSVLVDPTFSEKSTKTDSLLVQTIRTWTSELGSVTGTSADGAPPLPIDIGDQVIQLVESFDLRSMLWYKANHFHCWFNGNAIQLPTPTEIDTESMAAIGEAMNARNIRLGFPSPFGADVPKSGPAIQGPLKHKVKFQTDLLPSSLLHLSNRVGMGFTQGLGSANLWQPDLDGFAYGIQPFKSSDIRMSIGLPKSERAEALWRSLCKSGPVAVKTHFALWGAWYQAQRSQSDTPIVVVSINTMCEHLGYKKDRDSFPVQTKQNVRAMLEAFAQMEMKGSYKQGKDKPSQRFTGGRLWDIVLHEQEYGDLFGQAGVGEQKHWEPLQFAFRPGMAQLDEQWLSRNKYIGKISSGLLTIPNKEEWALLIGGYLAFQVRINQYRPFRLRISTILAAINRGQNQDARRKGELQSRFWHALDTLKEYNVIARYEKAIADTLAKEIVDYDDADELAEYYSENPEARSDWRNTVVIFTMPNESDMQRLEALQAKRLETASSSQRKRGRPKKNTPN